MFKLRNLIPILISCAFWTSAWSQINPPPDIIAWWPGDGNTNDIVGNNHGALMNGASYAAGIVGSAFQLDGSNDFVEVPDHASLRPATLTVEGWFNFSRSSGVFMLLGKTVGSNTHESFGIWYSNGNIVANMSSGTVYGAWLQYHWTPVTGTWYHIAYTFDDENNAQALYVNGAPVASGTITLSIGYDAHPFTIGSEYEYNSPYIFFPGRIDEVTLYGRALTPQEIQSIYNAGSDGKRKTPAIECPGNIITSAPAALCGARVSYNVTATGYPAPAIVCSPETGSVFSVGTTTVACTATNSSGTASCSFAVTVNDVTPPAVHTRTATVTLVNGIVSVTASDIDDNSSDACGIVSMTVSPNAFNCGTIGPHTVTLTATDASGNSATGTAVVTVAGSIPTVTATADPEYLVLPGGAKHTKYLGWGPASTTLNAAGAVSYVWTSDPAGFYSESPSPIVTPEVTTTYTVTGTSANGCTSTASVTITVVDVRCGNGGGNVLICHKCTGNGGICISPTSVQAHLNHGDYLGECRVSKESEIAAVPGTTILAQNHPNPFNPASVIDYYIPADTHVRISVFDMHGRQVQVLVDEMQRSGDHSVQFQAEDIPSGMYLYKLETDDKTLGRIMTLMK